MVRFRSVTKTLQPFLKVYRRNLKIQMGFIIITAFVIIAMFAPLINQARLNGEDPYSVGIYDPWLPPSWEHPLGTELYGRDVLALQLSGLRYTLIIGFLAGSIATMIGASLGLFAGYKGGIIDNILSAFTRGLLVIPTFPILLTFCLYMKLTSIFTVALLLAIFSWPASCLRIRAQVISLKEREYIELARVMGLRHLEIVFREIAPNLLPYIGLGLGGSIVGSMLAEAGISMMGFAPTGICTLGMFINWAIGWGSLVRGLYHFIMPPITILVMMFIAFNLINIGLDEYYNPRLRKVTGV